uniref:Uncharacterized protein n=1 Tax=Laticauda laticaudata TaxID=8630 RepID=A0A8C5RBZ2_LATLA
KCLGSCLSRSGIQQVLTSCGELVVKILSSSEKRQIPPMTGDFTISFPLVNLISDLQEQMCRLQLEINNQIQGRKSHNRKPSAEAVGSQNSTEWVTEFPSQENCFQCENLLQELKHLKIKVEELENERTQYEWKLKATKVSNPI